MTDRSLHSKTLQLDLFQLKVANLESLLRTLNDGGVRLPGGSALKSNFFELLTDLQESLNGGAALMFIEAFSF